MYNNIMKVIDKTNAERQKRFRERRKAEGLRVKWVSPGELRKRRTEFFAKAQDVYPAISQGEFNGALKKALSILKPEEKWVSDLILAEIAAYAEVAAAKFKKIAAETNATAQ
jgi:hypothetical protein